MSIENYPAKMTSGYYRVRETWKDAASQLGAYRILANAIAKADENPGYYVFSDDGVSIYPEEDAVEEVSGIEKENGAEEESSTEETTGDGTEEAIDAAGDCETDETVTIDTEDDMGTEAGNDSVSSKDSSSADAEETQASGGGSANDDVAEEDTSTEGEASLSDGGIPSDDEFPTATEYENDDNEDTIAYARLKTLMNIRVGNSLEADILTIYKKDTVLEILQFCSNGWLRFKSAASDTGYAYVSNEDGQYAYIGYGLYTVKRGDNLWIIAEEQLGDGTRYTEIRTLNGLTSNATRVGMQLILPQR